MEFVLLTALLSQPILKGFGQVFLERVCSKVKHGKLRLLVGNEAKTGKSGDDETKKEKGKK